MAAVNKYRVTELILNSNQLGPEGGAKLAEALKTNTALEVLGCALAALEPMPSARSCEPLPSARSCGRAPQGAPQSVQLPTPSASRFASCGVMVAGLSRGGAGSE